MNRKLTNQEAEDDNLFVPILYQLGVGVETQRLFFNRLNTDFAGRLQFEYVNHECVVDTEMFGLNTHRLSCSEGVWLAGDTFFPKDIFVFFSAVEAIAFAQLSHLKYDFENRCLFVALGAKPIRTQLQQLKAQYGKARYHTVFGSDLLSKIYDCKVSLWLENKDCRFFLRNELILIQSERRGKIKQITLERSKFSYSTFCRQFGKRPNIQLHKPGGASASSYTDVLIKNLFQP